MFSGFSPDRENSRGARWNPPEVPAIYTSLKRETAIAEGDYYIALQPRRPWPRRTIHRIKVVLSSVIDLSNWELLAKFGVNRKSFDSTDYFATQLLGGAAEWMKHDGILVPSARASGKNLIIYPNRQTESYRFIPVDSEEL